MQTLLNGALNALRDGKHSLQYGHQRICVDPHVIATEDGNCGVTSKSLQLNGGGEL